MRTLLAGEFTTATAGDTAVDLYLKLEVQNGSGTWVDVGASLGKGWVINATWGEAIDTPVSQATFTLVQRVGTSSLAPLMSTSPLNVDDLGAYSPLLNVGRLIRMSTATMAIGVALDVTKYRRMFDGRIDTLDIADAVDQQEGPVTIGCSDLGGWLMDLQVETDGIQYGTSPVGTALETVIQNIITANIPSGEPAVTLVKQSASSFAVTDYKQGATKLLEALTGLVLDTTGEDLRYRYDASHVSQLTWFNPNRSRVTVDQTFGANTYLLKTLDLSLANIRNAGQMPYPGGLVTAASAGSVALYRRRFFTLAANVMVQTEAQALTVLQAVVNDLGFPPAEASAAMPYLWFVQLYDRYTFTQNSRQYDQDQTFGVVGYQHSIVNSQGSTTLTVAGRIVGAFAEWLKRIGDNSVVPEDAISLNNFKWTDSADGLTRTFTMTAGANIFRVSVFLKTLAVPPLTDPWPPTDATALAAWFAGGGTMTTLIPDPTTRIVTYVLTMPSVINQTFVQFEPRLADWTAGHLRRAVVDPLPLVAIAQGTVTIDANGAPRWSEDGPAAQDHVTYAESTSAFPSDATAIAGASISGRQVSHSSGLTLSLGQALYVTIVPWTVEGTALQSIRLSATYQNTSGSRTTRYAASAFFNTSSTNSAAATRVEWIYSPDGKTTSDGTGTPDKHFANVPVALGMTIRAVRLRSNTQKQYSQVAMKLWRQDADGSSTQLGSTQTATNAGYSTLTVGSLSESASAGRSYTIECDTMYDILHLNILGTGMLWFEVDQDYPNPVTNL